ncbi:hypothetical protein Goe27_02340 [Bacillus phage vB_BsuM-Goe27]|uniref:Uncharacterized protein n=1 Tax=Bacillus phage vB_BsuM-Goe3 TaxID=1933063 RepID=A0A217ERF1_BPGO3|nr:hypothetical protein HWB07_gp082 [Bacillus phage vB_BsuM-Goe3]APZ82688.1 hypothetical protein Goe3_c22700 [Bacillus phage vB_BsuM-Goe3]QDP43256.1 hypothetical protein Goe7_c02310 [Bacillus phage vB_BveM-Goe7]WCS69608.1 hypothetical protein Goe24_02330 [Bacillus phage vB_BsuM-Goe24]WCS70112.1 hypothetical protein Goe27_02340 [Bacillus phage vB_BsuM-Goe27]
MKAYDEYTIGHYTLCMRQGGGGYVGHYTDTVSGNTFSFHAEGMTKRQILKRFWNRLK